MKSDRNIEVNRILHNKSYSLKKNSKLCFAPINIALIKYWGKKDENLNIPMSKSLSISSSYLGTETQIFLSEKDEVILNGSCVDEKFFNRTFEFVDLWRRALSFKQKIKIITNNNIPTESGLASSASGFASLTYALNDFFSLNLSLQELSCLARIGSGSACRSVFGKRSFVVWDDKNAKLFDFQKNTSFLAENMDIIIVVLDLNKKKCSSREAMKKTKMNWIKNKNSIYNKWLSQTKKDIVFIKKAKSWQDFGEIVEKNSLLMHEAIQEVGINYFNSKTLKILNFVKDCRANGLFFYATIDAGANVAIIYQKQDKHKLIKAINKIDFIDDIKILDF